MPIVLQPNSSLPAAGYYANQTDLERVCGRENVARWSQLDNDIATASSDDIQTALVNADSDVDNLMRGGPYTVPLPVNDTTTTWACWLAGAFLADRRPHGTDNPVEWILKKACAVRNEMAMFKAGILRFDDSTPGPSRLPQVPQSVIV